MLIVIKLTVVILTVVVSVQNSGVWMSVLPYIISLIFIIFCIKNWNCQIREMSLKLKKKTGTFLQKTQLWFFKFF